MPACDSISKILLFSGLTLLPLSAFAVDPPPPAFPAAPAGEFGSPGGGRTQQPEEDDFKSTPYTSFGEFNDEEEAEDTRFFQYGRFFGVSLGLGYEGATGNKGSLFTGGIPAFEARVHYWFDFNFALTLGIYSAKHQYTGLKNTTSNDTTRSKHDVNIFRFGAELRYYFDTRDATAPVTFAGPFLIIGVGSYAKSENSLEDAGVVFKDNALGLSLGAGLEFPLKPRKSYLNLETKFHSVSFNDTGLPIMTANGRAVPDSSGLLFTVMASVLFTY